ncbi:DUF6884 domain-containing protein [Salirhabdus sp. Marseille-P4669]|uniref:DUF6884 domain-containing protein n=1 Tax=Salirhabdus sp. Marseille-P4669 TaxID=2042310 RepID=UPI000C7BA633|nr:DUF6884 domain-containing protein [Salirhabdus sp. Marseille-P4669]
MEQLCIIPSGKPKIWDKSPEIGAVKASEAYTGTFHRLCQQYAKMHYSNWVILSPKYGFLRPDDRIEKTYDLSFSNKNDPNVISITELKEQVQSYRLHDVREVVMLGGKKFKPIVEMLFGDPIKRTFPLHGLKGIGYMQQRLRDAIHNKEIL